MSTSERALCCSCRPPRCYCCARAAPQHANHENGSNWNSLRDMVHRLDGDVHNNSEKIAIETDWREKGDDELSNKIEQVYDILNLIINIYFI